MCDLMSETFSLSKMQLQILFLIFSLFFLLNGAPITDMNAMTYLVDYGYMDPKAMMQESEIPPDKMMSMFNNAVREFQRFVGLQVTGQMDNNTKAAMLRPRCGVKDKFEFTNPSSRKRRYILSGDKWMKSELTYSIIMYPKSVEMHKLTHAAIEEEFAAAVFAWQNFTNLSFKHVEGEADITFGFSLDNNETGVIFPPGVLAIAQMPPYGKVRFNDAVDWTIRQKTGWNLFSAAVHEIGHALGLNHSDMLGSIMQPMLTQGYQPGFMLHKDDVMGIQVLYGPKKVPLPNLCEDGSFDAILNNPDGTFYILKGQYYWKLCIDGLMAGYPRTIGHRWPGLPSDVDAAVAMSTWVTYFFKDDKYWAFNYSTLIPGHPKLISEGWPGIPNNLEGATWYKDSKFYFFKDNQYWLFDSHEVPNVPKDFPKESRDWHETIHGKLDDVMYVPSGFMYFFSEGSYNRYNNKTKLVDEDYPRSVRNWWFRCKGHKSQRDETDEDNLV